MYTQQHKESVLSEHETVIAANENLLKAIDEELKKETLSNYERAKLEFDKLQLSIGLKHKKKAYEDVKQHFESWQKDHEKIMELVNKDFDEVVKRASKVRNDKVYAILKKLGENQDKINSDSLLKRRYYEDLQKFL